MADIALRSYLKHIDQLIDQKDLDEALAYCRNILNHFPKCVAAYRLMGKALLERGRHGDAADIFQRVLSATPDDFISHVGMAIVREDEANIDAALWHMERAFEANPANPAIQDELRRLYGRRDGLVPPRAQLTRGALARLYFRGGLFTQAETELRAGLQEHPDRPDLQVLLTQVLWECNRRVEAAELAAQLLEALPHCLEANRILADYLTAQNRLDDARPYRQRIEALDPYEAYATLGLAAGHVNGDVIKISEVAYAPELGDTGTTTWVNSLGADIPASDVAMPEWVRSGTSFLTGSLAAPAASAEAMDWMREAGFAAELSSDAPALTPTEAETGAQPLAPNPAAEAIDFTPPDWLAAASQGATADGNDLPDWLRSTAADAPTAEMADWDPPAPTPASAMASADVDVWADLSSGFAGGGALASDPQPEADPQVSASEDGLPDWLHAAAQTGTLSPASTPATGADGSDLPAWLTTAAGDVQTQPVPDWLPASPAADAPTEATPARLPTSAAPDAQAADTPEWLKTGAADLTPDWLQSAEIMSPSDGLPTQPEATSTPTLPSEPSPIGPAATAAALPAESDGAETKETLPDWLTTAGTDLSDFPDWLYTDPPATAQAPGRDPVPDGLTPSAAQANVTPNTPDEGMSSTPAIPPQVVGDEEGDVPDWLRQASVQTGPLGAAPDWLSADDTLGLTAPETSVRVPAQRPGASVAWPTISPVEADDSDLPDWLRQAATTRDQTTSHDLSASDELAWLRPDGPATPATPDATPSGASPADSFSVSEVELPAFLQPASPEAIARAEAPVDWSTDEDGAEPAAAEEAAPELDAAVPDWVQALAPSADQLAALPERSLEAVPGLSDEDLPDWLRTPTADPTQPTADPAAALDAVTFDAQTLATPHSEGAPNGETADLSTDDALAWLEGLALQQGVDPAELGQAAIAESATMPVMAEAVTFEGETSAVAANESAPTAEATDLSTDDALAWLEGLALQQGVDPAELGQAAIAESATMPVMPQSVSFEGDAPVSIASENAPATAADLSTDDALAWLETLALQQGTDLAELGLSSDITAVHDGVAESVSLTITDTQPMQPVALDLSDPALEAQAEAPTLGFEPEPSVEWLRTPSATAEGDEPAADLPDRIQHDAAAEEPAAATQVAAADEDNARTALPESDAPTEAESEAPIEPVKRTSLLAGKLAERRRAKEAEIQARFDAQRESREAAQRDVEARLAARRAALGGEGATAAPASAFSLRPTEPLPAGEPETATSEPTTAASGQAVSVSGQALTASALARAGTGPLGVPGKPRTPPAFAGVEPRDLLERSRVQLIAGQEAFAFEGFGHLIKQGALLDAVTIDLERHVATGAPSALALRCLGDAYLKAGRLQNALDAYRQALDRL
jgi:tetratricopeptide (TPR) repeat protein